MWVGRLYESPFHIFICSYISTCVTQRCIDTWTFKYIKSRSTMMADQYAERPPQQEHSRQPQPVNRTKPKASKCNPHYQNHKRQQQQVKETRITVSSTVLKYNNLYTWRWPVRPKHVAKYCLLKEQRRTLHIDDEETPKSMFVISDSIRKSIDTMIYITSYCFPFAHSVPACS
jgi:hypothetical protein